MDGNIILVFLLIILVTLFSKKRSVFICFAVLLWLFSFRTNEIPDTETYGWMYEDPISRFGYNEFGYLFVGYVFKIVTDAEFIVFYLTMVGVCLLLWYYGSRKLLPNNEHFGMLFLIFISFFGFLYMGVLIRNSISELLVLCGLSMFITQNGKKRYILFLLFIGIATLFHKSSLFFLFFIPLFRIKISTIAYYRLFLICVTVWMISGVGLAKDIVEEISKISMFSNYEKFATSSELSPNMFSLQVLISIFISYCAIRNNEKIESGYKIIYNYFLKINMVGLVVLSIIWSLPTSYRFYNMFFFFNYILIYLMIFQNERIRTMSKQLFYSVSISVVYFLILLHSFSFMLLY